jgi:hypothetical protein
MDGLTGIFHRSGTCSPRVSRGNLDQDQTRAEAFRNSTTMTKLPKWPTCATCHKPLTFHPKGSRGPHVSLALLGEAARDRWRFRRKDGATLSDEVSIPATGPNTPPRGPVDGPSSQPPKAPKVAGAASGAACVPHLFQFHHTFSLEMVMLACFFASGLV